MFGINYYKAAPTTYAMQFVAGQVKREGTGLSFFYFAPSTTLVAVPIGSTDVPFIFNETTADFQTINLQGHLTFRVKDAKKLAGVLDYSITRSGDFASDDPDKIGLRITHAAQNAVRAEVQSKPLRSVTRFRAVTSSSCSTATSVQKWSLPSTRSRPPDTKLHA